MVVTLYQHIHYRGYSVQLDVGNYDMNTLRSRGVKNDDISSIKVSSGYKITIYEHAKYRGKSLALTSHVPNLVIVNWNDIISSVKIEKVELSQTASLYRIVKHACVSLVIKKGGSTYYGSGFIIEHRNKFYICTAAHNIIDGSPYTYADTVSASVTTILGFKKNFEVSIIGVGAYADIGFLSIPHKYQNIGLHSLSFARDEPSIGDDSYVIGDPLGIDSQSISKGVVRDNKFIYLNTIKSVSITNSVYPGNSGSPAINNLGEVISIISYGINNSFSWGSSSDVIESLRDHILNGYIAQNNTGMVNFVGGTINANIYPVDSLYLMNNTINDDNLIGYYVSSSSNPNLNTNEIITKLNGKELGLYENQYSPVWIYLNPGANYTISVRSKDSSNNLTTETTKILTTSTLNSTEDNFLGANDNNNHIRMTVIGPYKLQ